MIWARWVKNFGTKNDTLGRVRGFFYETKHLNLFISFSLWTLINIPGNAL